MKNETAIDGIDPSRLFQIRQHGEPIDLIDVSSPVEFEELRVPFARNLPIDSDELERNMELRQGQSSAPLYVMCRGGVRSVKVCKKYPDANLVNIEGGTGNWIDCGLPVTRNKAVVSLERQVRIIAGTLTLAGSALATIVHPAFLGLPAFVGAGLLFAGVTNTCGMAMLLTKMPWNKNVKPIQPQTTESFSH